MRGECQANIRQLPDWNARYAEELAPRTRTHSRLLGNDLVDQSDRAVIFEAHISAAYLQDVIGDAKRRLPGKPIKAIVMTSDPWAHSGGVRAAIALGIPIYVSAGNVPFLAALARTPHSLLPDSLQRAPRAPRFVAVSRKATIGSGENRIELYPVGAEYGERTLMAYFPAHRLLYGADLTIRMTGLMRTERPRRTLRTPLRENDCRSIPSSASRTKLPWIGGSSLRNHDSAGYALR